MDGMLPATAAAQWLRLVQTASMCGRQLRRALGELVGPRGLTDSQCLVLWACCEAPPEGQAQHDLATPIGVSPAQLSGLLEDLAARGLVTGRRPAHDRRRQYWRLTTEGRLLVGALLSDLAHWLATSPPLSDAERAPLISRLAHLTTNLSAAHAGRGKEAA
jgi:DNA-binding MarR family transcriptional regulator